MAEIKSGDLNIGPSKKPKTQQSKQSVQQSKTSGISPYEMSRMDEMFRNAQAPPPAIRQIGSQVAGSQAPPPSGIGADPNDPSNPNPDFSQPESSPGSPRTVRFSDDMIDTRGEEAMWKHMENFPQHNEPSRWRRLGVALGGLGKGDHTAWQEYARDPQFAYEMADWKEKLPPLEQVALQERLSNQGIRTAEYQNRLADASNIRANAQASREQRLASLAAQGDFIPLFVKGGNIWRFNKKTGEMQDTGEKSGDNPLDVIKAQGQVIENRMLQELMLRQQNTLEAQNNQGRLNSQRDRQRHVDRLAELAVPRQQIVQTETSTKVEGTNDPDDIKKARQNRMIELYSKEPEAQKYFRIDKFGDPEMDDDKEAGSVAGFTYRDAIQIPEETRRRWWEFVLQDQPGRKTVVTRKPIGGAVSPVMPGANATDMIKVRRKSDGVEGTMPRANFNPEVYDEIK